MKLLEFKYLTISEFNALSCVMEEANA